MLGNGNILGKYAERWSESVFKEISEVNLSQSFKNIYNKSLYQMKIVDSRECPLCNNTPKTIKHTFIECQKTHTLWRQVKLWLSMVLKGKIKISDSERIFGTAYKNSIID